MTESALSRAEPLVHCSRGGATPPLEAIGGKAHHLARLEDAIATSDVTATVPRWVVLSTAAFSRTVDPLGPRPFTAAEAERRRALVQEVELPAGLRKEVLDALAAVGLRHARLAVRSSAVVEDAAAASYAGQFDTALGVEPGEDGAALWDAIRRVWASAFGVHAQAYGRATAPDGAPRDAPFGAPMAVILQEMVVAEAAGVAFAADPVSGDRDVAVVSAVLGLGEGLVSGELDADTWRVARGDGSPRVVERHAVRKETAVRSAPEGGTRLENVAGAQRYEPALTDAEACRVAACAWRLSWLLGRPQDVEWALAVGGSAGAERRLLVLQTRPITTLARTLTIPYLERRVWDNSNIVESYSGVTTPLTYSFARSVYEDVYRQFCSVMGVSESLIRAHEPVFANMLGLVRGRVYYNLINWYRVLALLPGFQWNRGFMERMMGVRERLHHAPAPPRGSRGRDFLRLLRMVGRMLVAWGGLGRGVPAFHARVDAAVAPLAKEDLSARPVDDLVRLYHALERDLLHHWRVPLVNDFFAMVSFGVLGRLTASWLPSAPPTLVNDLLCGEGGIVSTEPARLVMGLAQKASTSPALRAAFASEPDDAALWTRIGADPALASFKADVQAYLDRFGDRCTEELKLETITLGEDPTFLIQTVRAYVAGGITSPQAAAEREQRVRRTAEDRVRTELHPIRRWFYLKVLAETRARVRDRENLRFERTRVFGLVRRLFRALGQHLAEPSLIDRTRDVFYLTKEELLGWAEGTSVTRDLRALIALRRSEFETFAREPAPPDRFETTRPVSEMPAGGPPPTAGAPAPDPGAELRGTGACPGVVKGRVRIVRDPRAAGDLAGRILVAERTDPGWTLLFPAAAGLLVQRGSLLSHSAIVAREMGLPCVVGIPGLLDALRDDELVEMDGTWGTVRRIGQR